MAEADKASSGGTLFMIRTDTGLHPVEDKFFEAIRQAKGLNDPTARITKPGQDETLWPLPESK